MTKHANETYLIAIRQQDPLVLRDYYHDFYPSVRSFVVKNSGTEEDAQDIFGDVTEAILRKSRDETFTLTCKMNTFLTEIGARLWLKKLRRKKFSSGVTTDDPAVLKYVADFIQPLEVTERYALYRQHFSKLDDQCKEVIRLGIQEGKSHEEVMQATGLTLAYSRKIRSRCLKKLTALIKADPRFAELKSEGKI